MLGKKLGQLKNYDNVEGGEEGREEGRGRGAEEGGGGRGNHPLINTVPSIITVTIYPFHSFRNFQKYILI